MSSSSRTPSRSPAPPLNTALPPMPPDEPSTGAAASQTPETPRRSSFSFLRRGKSVERLNSKRSTSGGKKLTKKQLKEQDHNAPQDMVPMEAPKIPNLASHPSLQTFGGENTRPDSFAVVANRAGSSAQYQARHASPSSDGQVGTRDVPVPPLPHGGYVDPYAPAESMTNRGRYSYASSAISSVNNPRRVRRRKDPTPFNILVVGARNSGKSAFADFLRTSLTLPARKMRPVRDDFAPEPGPSKFNPAFVAQYLETELDDGERIGLTLWDSEGLEQNIIDLQLRQTVAFIESKFEETFNEEVKIIRSPGARDTHIHCVFLILDPLRLDKTMGPNQPGGLATNGNLSGRSFIEPPSPNSGAKSEDLDIQVLRALQGKTTVVPVISKADTITVDHMNVLKRSVWSSLKQSGLDHLEALGLDEDEAAESSDSDDGGSIVVPVAIASKQSIERHDVTLHPESALDPDDRSLHSRLDLTSSSEASSAKAPTPKERKARSPKIRSPSSPYLPLSILSPSPIVPHEPGVGKVGRRFPWGFADPYDPKHCDFVKLRDSVFGEWRSELREASRDVWYEQWRTRRLNRSSTAPIKGGASRGRTPLDRENVARATGSIGAGTRGRVSVPVAMGGPIPANQANWPLPAR